MRMVMAYRVEMDERSRLASSHVMSCALRYEPLHARLRDSMNLPRSTFGAYKRIWPQARRYRAHLVG